MPMEARDIGASAAGVVNSSCELLGMGAGSALNGSLAPPLNS